MGSFSIWHWLILLVLFGSPFAMYFVIASGSRTELQRQRAFLHGSFVAWIVGFVVLIASTLSGEGSDSSLIALGAAVLVIAVSGWSYLISLGLLAKRTGRSWMLWSGLAFITSPIGILVSYPLMIGVLSEHRKGRANAA